MADHPLTIALDIESVLANTQQAFLDRYNAEYGTAYLPEHAVSWEWVLDALEPGAFVEITDRMWADEWHTISPHEPGLPETVTRLSTIATVDIVTARTGRLPEMEAWLNRTGITSSMYRQVFSSEGAVKHEYSYDVYIDDYPYLASGLVPPEVQAMLIRPHNQGYRDHPNVVPVRTVRTAVDVIEYLEAASPL